jgi:hypothetical protein
MQKPAAFCGIPHLERPAWATHGVYRLTDHTGVLVKAHYARVG